MHKRIIEVETSTHCNWRCLFCPQSIAPKDPKVMSLELFEEIISKAKDFGVRVTVINAYNEPTINPNFLAYVEILRRYGMVLRLYTNGTALTSDKIAALKTIPHELCFNLPSLDEAEFTRLTGGAKLHQSMKHIDAAIAADLNLGFSVNGSPAELAKNFPAIYTKYKDFMAGTRHALIETQCYTNDRTGLLGPPYNLGYNFTEPRLYGCFTKVNSLSINVNGDFFMCCEDYHQKTIYANIKDGTIAETLQFPRYLELESQIDGSADAPADLICRKCNVMAHAKARALKRRTEDGREL